MKKDDSIMKSARIEKKLNENVVKYCSKNGISYTKAINDGLKLLTRTQVIEDNLEDILKTIERRINDILEPHVKSERKIMAKCAKASLSTAFLNAEVYKSLFNEQEEILQELFDKSDKEAYIVLKNGYIDGDITELFNHNPNLKKENKDNE